MKTIDGSFGEGGGQILRSSLSLALMTQTEVEIVNVRSGRSKPGLLKQHLCAVNAAVQICDGQADGAELGSQRVRLRPGPVRAGTYRFSVGSAGSASLVLQTVLPPLMRAAGPSRVTVEGGTHNPAAPPFEFLNDAFGPAIRAMGAQLDLHLDRAGFYPSGGGRIVADIRPPSAAWVPFVRVDRGALIERRASILSSGLPAHVERRERAVLQARLGEDLRVVPGRYEAFGPGNAVVVELVYESGRSVFVGFGARGKKAERVAAEAADQAERFMASSTAVDPYLADQLLLPMVVGAGGQFSTGPLTAHASTNIFVIKQFVDAEIRVESAAEGSSVVNVQPAH